MLLNQLSENSKNLFLNLEVFLANVDGEYSESEDRIIRMHCKEMGLEIIQYNENVMLEDIFKNINSEMTVKEKKIIFIELLAVVFIDGVYDDREKEFIENLRKLLYIPENVGQQAFDMVKKLVESFVE